MASLMEAVTRIAWHRSLSTEILHACQRIDARRVQWCTLLPCPSPAHHPAAVPDIRLVPPPHSHHRPSVRIQSTALLPRMSKTPSWLRLRPRYRSSRHIYFMS